MSTRMQHGFTLVEMLVALTILALISIMSWRGLDAVLRADEQLGEQASQTQALFNALSQMARDLEQHVQTPGMSTEPAMPVLPASIRWQAEGQGPALLLIERRTEQGQGVQQIQWRLQEGRLQRGAGLAGQDYPLPEPGPLLDVLAPVSAWQLRIWIPARGWQSWPWPQEAGMAATGIELSLRLGQDEHPYRKVVMLP